MNTQADWPARLTRAIAAEIRRCRKARGMSAQQLSDQCGKLGLDLPRSTLADLENGRRVTLSVAELLVLARALDVPPVMLVFAVGAEPETEVLPGQPRPTFPAAEWASGAGPFPADALLTVGEPPESARVLSLYREHGRAALEEIRAWQTSHAVRGLVDAASNEQQAALTVAVEGQERAAREYRDMGQRLRDECVKHGWLPPAPVVPVPEGAGDVDTAGRARLAGGTGHG